MLALDPHVLVNQWRGQFLGKTIQCENPRMSQIGQDLFSPEQDVSGSRGFEERRTTLGLTFVDRTVFINWIEQLVIAEEDRQWQTPPDQVGDMCFDA